MPLGQLRQQQLATTNPGCKPCSCRKCCETQKVEAETLKTPEKRHLKLLFRFVACPHNPAGASRLPGQPGPCPESRSEGPRSAQHPPWIPPINACIHVCIHVCMCVYIYMHACLHAYVCMYVATTCHRRPKSSCDCCRKSIPCMPDGLRTCLPG